MNIAAPFIRRPVATTLLMFAVLLFGILGYRSLLVSDLPNVDFPTLLVIANLPGANPETMVSAGHRRLPQRVAGAFGGAGGGDRQRRGR